MNLNLRALNALGQQATEHPPLPGGHSKRSPSHLRLVIGKTEEGKAWHSRASARCDLPEAHCRSGVNRVGGFLTVPASHTTGHTFYVPRRFPEVCNAR